MAEAGERPDAEVEAAAMSKEDCGEVCFAPAAMPGAGPTEPPLENCFKRYPTSFADRLFLGSQTSNCNITSVVVSFTGRLGFHLRDKFARVAGSLGALSPTENSAKCDNSTMPRH